MEFKNRYIYTQQMFREFVKYYKYRYLHAGIIFLIGSTVFCLFIANKFDLVNIKFVLCMIGMIILLFLINFLYTLESEILYKNSLDEVCKIMSITPKWAEGLFLKADGYECNYYKKE